MKYKYPKELEIGGQTYKVELLDSFAVDDEANCGIHKKSAAQARIATRTMTGGYASTNYINLTF